MDSSATHGAVTSVPRWLWSVLRSRRRVTRRVGRVAAAGARRLPLSLLWRGTVAVLLLLGAATGSLDKAAARLSALDVVAAALAVALVASAWSAWTARGALHILPFHPVTAPFSPRAPLVERLAAGLAAELADELQRIATVLAHETDEAPAISDSSLKRTSPVPPTSRPARFRAAKPDAGLAVEAVGSTTVGLGPLRVPVALLAVAAARVTHHLVHGRVVDTGGLTRVTVTLPDGSEEHLDVDVELADLRCVAQDLAHRVAWRTLADRPAGADACSFRSLVEGLAAFSRYARHGSLTDLADAEEHLLAATRHSPDFALALSDLGLVQNERWRVHDQLGLGRSVDPSAARASWRRALAADPDLLRARLDLARHDAQASGSGATGDAEERVAEARRLVELTRHHPLENRDARLHLALVLGDLATEAAAAGTAKAARTALGQARAALDQLLLVRESLRDTYVEQRVAGRSTASLAMVRDEWAEVLLYEALVHRDVVASVVQDAPSAHRARANAERHLRQAVRLRPDRADAHRELGGLLLSTGRYEEGYGELLLALAGDGGATPTVTTTAQLLHDLDEPVAAAAARSFAQVAVLLRPDDHELWQLLAELETDGDARLALEAVSDALAGADTPSGPDASPPPDPAAALWSTTWWQTWREAWREARLAEDREDTRALQDAVQRLDEGFTQHPTAAEAHVAPTAHLLGVLHGRLAAATGGAQAAAHARRALELFTTSREQRVAGLERLPPAWLLDQADVLVDAPTGVRDLDAAVQLYTKVLDAALPSFSLLDDHVGSVTLGGDPAQDALRARALASRAVAHLTANRLVDAMRDCRDAIRREPGYAFPYTVLAELARRRGQYDEALRAWQAVAELAPGSLSEVQQRIGELHRVQAAESADEHQRRAWLEKAVAAYSQALALDPATKSDVQIRVRLASALVDLGLVEAALAEHHLAVDLSQGLDVAVDVHLELGRQLAGLGRPAEAEVVLREAVRLTGEVADDDVDAVRRAADAENELAWLLVDECTCLEEAHRLAERAVQHATAVEDPQLLARVLDTRGWSHVRAGRYDDAVRDLERALAVATGNAERWQHLGLALEARYESRAQGRASDLARARTCWTFLLERNPDDEQAAKALDRLAALDRAPTRRSSPRAPQPTPTSAPEQRRS